MMKKHFVFTAMKNMDLHKRPGLCARSASCGLMKTVLTWKVNCNSSLVICAEIDV
jgi:hypothetical protein